MGLPKLRARVAEPGLAVALAGMFPRDNLRHTRFAVNFFTSIGLGALTDELRDFLKKQQQVAASTVAAVLQ
jgi:pre-mRNA-splicing factor CWC22